MTADDLLKVLNQTDGPVVVDVRSRFEFRRGHIPGAVHVPFLQAAVASDDLPQDRQRAVVITCEHGPRALLAIGLLRLRGYRSLSLLQGHMHGWRQAGLPLEF